MRTRTFIGMILLILVLIVASTPSLLDVVSGGVQNAGARAGVPGMKAPKPSSTTAVATKGGGKVNSQLELKGYLVGKPDLRDGYSDAERAATESYRLGSGAHRQLLANQPKDGMLGSDPIPGANGVLLDSAGCPRFSADDDVVTLMADPTMAALYDGKVAAADDPAACKVAFAARVKAADPAQQATPGTSASKRHYSTRQLDSMDIADLYVELQGIDMLAGMFGSQPSTSRAATSIGGALQ